MKKNHTTQVEPAARGALPLSMLRAFEAAARHASMSRAAVELSVTHGAVSRQIVALERRLGVQLFKRMSRGVQLTEQGTYLFHGVYAGLERIRVTLYDLQTDRRQHPVTITTLPTLASRWLIPRLVRFQAEHSKILVNVRTSVELDDLADPLIDFGIRYGTGAWSNTASELLLSPNAYPVCSPSFLEKYTSLESPADLLEAPLIHNVTRQWWTDWFVAAGVNAGGLHGGIVVDEYGLAIQFALDGYGVVLARDPLLDRDLASGALVRLFDISVAPRFGYYLVRSAARRPNRDSEILMRWLLAEARKDLDGRRCRSISQ